MGANLRNLYHGYLVQNCFQITVITLTTLAFRMLERMEKSMRKTIRIGVMITQQLMRHSTSRWFSTNLQPLHY